ncbi:MAG: GYF domain-containing protein [Verrucomicrobiota bacterium]
MAMIHVNRNRETLGKFTDQEVADGLKSGRFLPDDLAWKDPMPAWQPLSTFTELPEASSEDQKSAVLEIPVESVVEPAWQRVRGFSIGAAIQSVKQVFENPASTFSNLSPTAGIGRSLAFFLLLSWVCGSVAVGYECLAAWINPDSLLQSLAQFPEPIRQELQSWFDTQGHKKAILFVFASSVAFQPFFLLLRIFVFSLLVHLFLVVIGARSKNFGVTFQALAYSSGAAAALQIFPLVGTLLGVIGSFILGFLAVKNAHAASGWKVALAAFLVLMVSCGLVILLSASVYAMALGMFPKS